MNDLERLRNLVRIGDAEALARFETELRRRDADLDEIAFLLGENLNRTNFHLLVQFTNTHASKPGARILLAYLGHLSEEEMQEEAALIALLISILEGPLALRSDSMLPTVIQPSEGVPHYSTARTQAIREFEKVFGQQTIAKGIVLLPIEFESADLWMPLGWRLEAGTGIAGHAAGFKRLPRFLAAHVQARGPEGTLEWIIEPELLHGVWFDPSRDTVNAYFQSADVGLPPPFMPYVVHRVGIDSFDIEDWVDLDKISSFTGTDPEDLLRAARSDDHLARAWVIRDVAAYYGWGELDYTPDSRTAWELAVMTGETGFVDEYGL